MLSQILKIDNKNALENVKFNNAFNFNSAYNKQNYEEYFDNLIHKTAIVNWDRVVIGKGNVIGPYSCIGTEPPNILENSDDGLDNINFSVTFDKDKLHDLFYSRGISYSEVNDKDFYILPILSTNSNIFIFSNNYFYKNWNNVEENTLLEFILPLENLEIIQNINRSKNNLLDLEIENLLQEYENKNVAIAIIENENNDSEKIYIKTRIQNKIISKSLTLKREKLEKTDFNDKIIYEIKDELVNLVKSQNLIDIRTPSFLNVKLKLDKDNNLVLLNSKIDKIDLIENIFIQEFNNDYVKLKIKYLGKLEKIIDQLQNQNINLQLVNEQWLIKIS